MLRHLKKLLSRQVSTPPAQSLEAAFMTILHIDSSLGGYSVSRALSAEIVAKQQALHPGAKVIYRDLVVDAALHLSDRHLAIFQGGAVVDPAGKKVFIASSRGGVYTGDSPATSLEHQETYLRGVLSFIGLTNITVIRAEGLNLGDEAKTASVTKAKAEIAALVA
jgi:FMN-dependent NADH-azoreductase